MAHPRLTEDSLIERFRALAMSLRHKPSAGRPLILGIGDDAALFRARPGYDIILTTDWFLEGTHFLRDKHPPDSVGWKCLVRALSDVAAMGGFPSCFLLSVALEQSLTGRWLNEFLRGLGRASRRFQCVLAGGDTTRREKILISVAVAGEVPKGAALFRSGARPGDLIFVSGRLGEAESGLELLQRSKGLVNRGDALLKKHLYPEPRLVLGQWLAKKRLASAVMDLSDGLSSDLSRLCAASGVGARIWAAAVPIPAFPRRGPLPRDRLRLALHGGDDYELLFSLPCRERRRLPATFRGVALTEIGVVTKEKGVFLTDESGRVRPLAPGGWDPFQAKE